MKLLTILIPFVLLFGFQSCKTSKTKKEDTVSKEDTVKKENSVTKDEVESIIVQQGFVKPVTSDMFDMVKTSIEGNILTIEVSYSGGCNEHEFKLYFDGSYKKSLPPKADFMLTHDNKGDACRSIVDKTLKFDISKAQYVGGKEMMVTVEGFQEMSYTY